MKSTPPYRPLLIALATLLCFLIFYSANAQSTVPKPVFDYYELKGFLLKHKASVESMLAMKRFRLVSSKARAESTIFAYKRESDKTEILVRVRKKDDLVSEVAWNETLAALGNLTHDAVYDGFVPSINSKYYNRFRKLDCWLIMRWRMRQFPVLSGQSKILMTISERGTTVLTPPTGQTAC